jgi:hypothetical protein
MTKIIDKEKLQKTLTDLAPSAQQLLSDTITYPSIHGGEVELQTYLE